VYNFQYLNIVLHIKILRVVAKYWPKPLQYYVVLLGFNGYKYI